MSDDGTTLAPAGYVWVCLACGKTSETQFGFDKDNKNVAMQGWDESCMLNSRLIPENHIAERSPGGRVTRIKDPGPPGVSPAETAEPISDSGV